MLRRVVLYLLLSLTMLFIHIQTADAVVLREGSRGTEVTRLQQRLIDLGLLGTRATGVFGPATRDAVIRFQRANGLTADGVVGRNTNSALFPPVTSRADTPQSGTTVLREGNRGTEVTRLQQRLIDLGFLKTRATGFFGPATRDAVTRFQRANSLTANGVVESTTMQKLFPENPQTNPVVNPITTNLRRGSRGAQVTILQNRLIDLGLLSARANGIFGPLTQAAVELFQKINGLTVNGVVDQTTAQRIFATEEPKPTEPTPQPEPEPENPVQTNPTPQPETETPATPPSQPTANTPVSFNVVAGSLVGRTVIIDPGHGGSDPGAVRDGLMEKDINLDISLRLRRMLLDAGATVLMTRDTDVFRSLLFRSAFANRHVLQLEVDRLSRGDNSVPSQQTAQNVTNDGTVSAYEQQMNLLIALQIELVQLQQRLGDISSQIVIINDILNIWNALDEDNTQLQSAINNFDSVAEANERNEILQREIQLNDLAARIGMPGTSRQIANDNLFVRQTETEQITIRIGELNVLIATAQISLEQAQASTPTPPPSTPAPEATQPVNADNTAAINMWTSKIAMFDHYINNPRLESREGIFAISRDSANNVRANEMLTRVFDLTRERYQDNIVFISVHINSTTQNVTESSGIRMFYRHNGPTFAWGSSNPHYYMNYNAVSRRSLSQNLLNSLNAFTSFQGEVTEPTRMDFSVIRETNLVSALIEAGFINNVGDRTLMLQEQFREDAAAGIFTGLANFFNSPR